MGEGVARRRAQMPAGTQAILNARSLEQGHAQLTPHLFRGARVLDVGCGAGSITADIATAVAPGGHALGVDVNHELVVQARARYGELAGLSYRVGDVYGLAVADEFDVVTASRLVQWLDRPAEAIQRMVEVLKPGGVLEILDYDHTQARWGPQLPEEAQHFYSAFLQWRADAGMHNAIAVELPALLAAAGLDRVTSVAAPEECRGGSDGGAADILLWAHVAETRGHQIVASGFLREDERRQAARAFRSWASSPDAIQVLVLASVSGVKRSSVPTASEESPS